MNPLGAQTVRRWLPRALPTLHQGSTISIRCAVDKSHVLIRSKWRDDGEIFLVQNTVRGSPIGFNISQQAHQHTSLGRPESHLLVELISADPSMPGTIPYDSESYQEIIVQSEGVSLTLEVPEKINIDCDVSIGGSVKIEGKIEGDVRVRVVDGDVHVQKLRGHLIDIQLLGASCSLYASDLLEAKDLLVRLPSSGRFRAKRIHASSSNIQINESETSQIFARDVQASFDSDDTGAICDISSYYIACDATIDVRCSSGETRQAIRVKSNHGHLMACASAPISTRVDAFTNDRLPFVDIGGVNGSCEVFADNMDGAPSDTVSCRVHFDSLAPDSVSIIQATSGAIHVTLDRKIESDFRVLSTSMVDSVDVDALLLDKDDEEFDSLVAMLEDVDSKSTLYGNDPIQIKTKAFSSYASERVWENIRFVDGWMENRSEEPDSRFDRKLRGETGSLGKIRQDGASNQALQNFQGQAKSTFVRPIITILGSSNIMVETLSWLGNVARRYGLDGRREENDLGRTATRRGRSLESQ
jgi:hypothetical protein